MSDSATEVLGKPAAPPPAPNPIAEALAPPEVSPERRDALLEEDFSHLRPEMRDFQVVRRKAKLMKLGDPTYANYLFHETLAELKTQIADAHTKLDQLLDLATAKKK